MTDRMRPVAAVGPGADPAPGDPRGGVARRDMLRIAALVPALAPGLASALISEMSPGLVAELPEGAPEKVVISPGGWVLLESDLR